MPNQNYGAQRPIAGHGATSLPLRANTPLNPISTVQANTQMGGSYTFPSGEEYPPPSANAFGFEFESVGISSLNWLPMETGLIYQDASPVDLSAANWSQQFNPFPPAEVTLQNNNNFQNTNAYPAVPTPTSNDQHRAEHASPPAGDRSSQAPSSGKETVASGEFYLDGDGARLPRVKRRRLLSKTTTDQSTARLSLELRSSEAFSPDSINDHSSPTEFIMDAEMHRILHMVFEETCIRASLGALAYDSTSFPSPEALSQFVRLYFEYFHPITPFLHIGTFRNSNPHYALIAAMAAVGSHYAERVDGIFVSSMHEYVRRTINLLVSYLVCLFTA